MASEEDFIDSGATTPYRTPSTFTAPINRHCDPNDDTETICTELTPSSIGSASAAPSIISPDPPYNSPLTQSVASNSEEGGPNVASLAAKLELMRRAHPARAAASSYGSAEDFNFRLIMSPGSPPDDEVITGGGSVEGPSSHTTSMTPTPGAHQSNAASTEHIISADGGVLEYSAWETPAEEEVTKGLQRLTMLARDLHLRDPSRSVEEHYSERLSVVLRRAEIQFDCSAMHSETGEHLR